MKVLLAAITITALSLTVSIASADLAMDIYPASAPNPDLSPNWDSGDGYINNASIGIHFGLPTVAGGAGLPGAYATQTVFNPGDLIRSTDFNSWKGELNPTGNFVGEYGNLLHFGLRVTGDMAFEWENIQAEITSADPQGWFSDSMWLSGPGSHAYSTDTHLGIALFIDAEEQEGDTNEEKIDAIYDYFRDTGPINITMTYTAYDSTRTNVLGSASNTITIIPEPAPIGLFLIGLFPCRRCRSTSRTRNTSLE